MGYADHVLSHNMTKICLLKVLKKGKRPQDEAKGLLEGAKDPKEPAVGTKEKAPGRSIILVYSFTEDR